MKPNSDGIDEEVKDSITETRGTDEAEKILESLDKAAEEAEDDDAEYWIRTTAQRLLIEGDHDT